MWILLISSKETQIRSAQLRKHVNILGLHSPSSLSSNRPYFHFTFLQSEVESFPRSPNKIWKPASTKSLEAIFEPPAAPCLYSAVVVDIHIIVWIFWGECHSIGGRQSITGRSRIPINSQSEKVFLWRHSESRIFCEGSVSVPVLQVDSELLTREPAMISKPSKVT